MTVTKFYASWEKENGETEIINAFQGIRLRDDARIFTKPKEKGSLYDIETGLHVLPRQGRKNGKGQPYFSYYSKEESPLKNRPSSFAYTPELNVFLRAFDGIRKFRIQERISEPVVEVYVNHSWKLQRIEAELDYFIVKIYLELLETKPYSYFYKWNGRLALEFLATSEPIPFKRVRLAKRGIPLYEARAIIPEWIQKTLPEEFDTEEEFDQIAKRIRETYSNTNYRLLGKFEREAITLPEYKERYETMERFEIQCKELEEEIKKLNGEEEALKREKGKLRKEIKEQRKVLEAEKEQLEAYRRENEYYRRLEKDNARLTEEKETLQNEKNVLNEECRKAKEECQKAKEECQKAEEERQRSQNELREYQSRETWLSKRFRKK